MLAADDSSAAVAAALGAPSSHHLLAPVVAIAMAQRTGPAVRGPPPRPRRAGDTMRRDTMRAPRTNTHIHTHADMQWQHQTVSRGLSQHQCQKNLKGCIHGGNFRT